MRLDRIAEIVFVVLALAPLPALAQDATEEGRHQFELAMSAYEDGRFEDSLAHFERAYALTSAPELLFNIATVYDRLRSDREALDAYQRYLAARPDGSDRLNIERRIEALRLAIERDEAAPAPESVSLATTESIDVTPEATPEDGGSEDVAPTSAADSDALSDAGSTEASTTPDVPPLSTGPDPAAWVVLGSGIALTIAGIVTLAVAQLDAGAVGGGTYWPDIRSAYDRGPVEATVGSLLLGAGLVAAACGIAWVVLDMGAPASDTRIAISPFGLELRTEF